ncbi:hypothetical protein [Paraburkholderia caballeronis]|nr:hypothetical protein [Paraburkholderia caballeronis]
MLETVDDPFLVYTRPRVDADVFRPPRIVPAVGFIRTAEPNRASESTLKLAQLMMQSAHRNRDFLPTHLAVSQLVVAPHIRLMLKVFHDHPISDYALRNPRLDGPVAHGLIRAEIYNDFSRRFRLAARIQDGLHHELNNWYLGSAENLTNLDQYLGQRFEQHDSLTVIHLRLMHSRTRANLVTTQLRSQHNDLQVLRAYRTKFFDRMRRKPSLFTHDPGYVWSILPGMQYGYTLHLTLLLPTAGYNKMIEDLRVQASGLGSCLEHQDLVGRYWVEGVTDGHGCYLRSDKSPGLYGSDWVHGEVRAGDAVLRKKLKEALGYLAMRRALVRLKNEPKGQYFDMKNRKPRSTPRAPKGGVWAE